MTFKYADSQRGKEGCEEIEKESGNVGEAEYTRCQTRETGCEL